MDKRKLGKSELEFSVLTMGCWQAGGDAWQNVEDDESVAAMRAALDAGINAFDTAEGYNSGYSERILAKALEGKRDEVLIATKVGAGNLAYDKVIEACDRSLKNLSTDRIDLYQIHWPSGIVGLAHCALSRRRCAPLPPCASREKSGPSAFLTSTAPDRGGAQLRARRLAATALLALLGRLRAQRHLRHLRQAQRLRHSLLAARAGAAHGQVQPRQPPQRQPQRQRPLQ
jgi:hypothetical protein